MEAVSAVSCFVSSSDTLETLNPHLFSAIFTSHCSSHFIYYFQLFLIVLVFCWYEYIFFKNNNKSLCGL